MSDLIEMLSRLNMKERFYLIGQALGNETFELSSSFRKALSDKIGTRVPESAFAAMDYHLDWIAAGLQAYRDADIANETYSNSRGVVSGMQRDIDLLIAFEADEVCHLVLVEAKGYASWDNKQLLEKAQQLEILFGPAGNDHHPDVKPHFRLMSPRNPQKLQLVEWPRWMREYHWLKLELQHPRWQVTRCSSDGKPSTAIRDHFRFKEVAKRSG